jgi:hypothetical protein
VFPFEVSPQPRERQQLNRRMLELLADIERLEQAALRVPDPGEDEAAGARLDSVLEEARLQLKTLMREALELDEEDAPPDLYSETADEMIPYEIGPQIGAQIGSHEPLPTPSRAESREPLLEVTTAPPPTPAIRREVREGREAGSGETARSEAAREARELREIIARRQPAAASVREEPKRERPTEVESQGISIRVIPPSASDVEGGSRDVTLVFDLGPSQPPVRVSLPVDAAIGDQYTRRPFLPAPPRRFPMALVGALALAIVLTALAMLGAVWAGLVSPRAATATAQIEPSAAPRSLPAPPPAGAESRVLSHTGHRSRPGRRPRSRTQLAVA